MRYVSADGSRFRRMLRCAGLVLVLTAWGTRAAVPEYKTELATPAVAVAAGWQVIRGDAPKTGAPELSVVPDAAAGSHALRVDVKQPGLWQGLELVDSIDLMQHERLEFYVKQNVHTRGDPWALVVQVFFEDGGQATADVLMGLGEWTHIVLPLRSPPWQFSNRAKAFGRTVRIRFYPYRHMDEPGEFLQVDGLRFVPRAETGAVPGGGVRYTYVRLPDPDSDPGCTKLADGVISADQQVVFGPYGDDPSVVFDLGREQAVTRVTLRAVARPAANIASCLVEVRSADGDWQPAGSVANESVVQAVVDQALAVPCRGVGRHVRVTLTRPRVDVPVLLAEVNLDVRDPTQEDQDMTQSPPFEGPELPPVSADRADSAEYAVLRGERIVVFVHRATGVIGGLWTAESRRVLLRGWERYVFETRDGVTESSEYADAGSVTRVSRTELGFDGANADVPGVQVRKAYRLCANGREEWLEKTTSFTYTGSRPDVFVTVLTNTAMEPGFRTGGYYEGAQVRCDRVLAESVRFRRVMPATKSVMLSRPGAGRVTVTQYRHKVNGRFCLPYYGQNPMEAYNQTSCNGWGWEIGHATLRLSGEPEASVQVHTAVLEGGRFGWERHYVSLPEYKEYVAGLSRPAWLGSIKGIVLDTYRCVLWGRTERTAERLALVFDDGCMVAPGLTHMDGVWGELPVSGDAIDLFGGLTPTDELARMFSALKASPRFRVGIYMWLTSVNREVPVFRQHPDWFSQVNKQGEARVVFPQLKANVARIISIPEHRDFVVDQVEALHRRYPQDVWYLDGGNTAVNMIDWPSLRVSQDYHGQELCRRIRRKVREINPECAVFFNGADERLADIGFAEIGRHFGKEWRRTAARMFACKVRQSFDPERLMSPLYWVGPGDTYLRICTGLGFPPSGPAGMGTKHLLAAAPYLAAAFETRGLQFSPTRYAPDWREDASTAIEMVALRAGRALALSAVSHGEEESEQRLAAEVPEDVAAPGDTVFVVHHVLKPISGYEVPNSDFANKDAYRRTHWATGAVTELRGISSHKVGAQGWVSLAASLPPGQLSLFSLVETPVYVWSRNGSRANFLLPSVRRLHTEAESGGDRTSITVVSSTDEPVEVLILAPRGRRVVSSAVGGGPEAGTDVVLHGLRGRVVPLRASSAPTVVLAEFAEAQTVGAELRVTVPDEVKAGADLRVGIPEPGAGGVRCNVWRSGTLVYAGASAADPVAIATPVQAHNGSYEVEVVAESGARGRGSFVLTGHQATDVIPPETPPLEANVAIESVDVRRGDVTVVSKGLAEYGHCRPTFDLGSMTLKAEVPNECVSYYAHSMAGVELRGCRSLSVRVVHDMVPVRGLYPERHVLYETNPNAFIGFMLDYGTPGGYAKRVALSVGPMSLKRTSKRPEWGATRAPDHYLRLPSTIYTGEDLAGGLDLGTWAPEGWDGRVWVSVVMDLAQRSRHLALQLAELNPTPGSVPPLPVEDVQGTMQQLRERKVRVPRLTVVPVIDGDLNEPLWQEAVRTSSLLVVGKAGVAASQLTEVRVAYGERFVYLAFTAWERGKTGFDTTSGAAGRPWWDDAIEFSLGPASWQGRFLHQIVTADAVTHQQTATNMQETQHTSAVPVVCASRKYGDRFTVEAAVPLGEGGLPVPKPGETWRVQFMRTRVLPSGAREHAAWTVTEAFHDYTAFGEVVFE